MKKETNILIAENNKEDFELIKENLLRAGFCNDMLNITDGQEILDFLSNMDKEFEGEHNGCEYILFLNLDLPKVDGLKVLKKIKKNMKLKKIPVIIITTIDDQRTFEKCYNLGCSTYIVKPTERRDFEETFQKLGGFLSFIETTLIN